MEGFYNTKELKEKGWTDKMIRELLPEPVLGNNPYNPNIPVKRWKCADVEAVTGTAAYAEAMEKAARRKEAARKAAETKERKTAELVEKISQWIHVKKKPLERVLRAAYNSHISRQREREQMYGYDYVWFDKFEDIPEDVIKRWAVDYIRHSLTRYEDGLEMIQGRVGKDAAYIEIKTATLRKVAEAYPELSDECSRQIERISPVVGKDA